MTHTWCGLDFVVLANAISGPQLPDCSVCHAENTTIPGISGVSGAFPGIVLYTSKSQYVYLMPFLFCIAMRIIRILMAFLLYFFTSSMSSFKPKGQTQRKLYMELLP